MHDRYSPPSWPGQAQSQARPSTSSLIAATKGVHGAPAQAVTRLRRSRVGHWYSHGHHLGVASRALARRAGFIKPSHAFARMQCNPS